MAHNTISVQQEYELVDAVELDLWIKALTLCWQESEGEEREFYSEWCWMLEDELAYALFSRRSELTRVEVERLRKAH